MLEIYGIQKQFGEHQVLNGINIRVDKGDVVAILGPSGSGKTTLLRCINFLEKAERGTLHLGTIVADLAEAKPRDVREIRKKTGFVFQNYNLFARRTALENVMEPLLVVQKMNKKEAEEKAKIALDKVGMSDRYGYYPSQLSGGQQQRVGIARAIAVEPQVLLLDEPTSSLDPELVEEVLGVIKKIAKEGTTMLIVTHELSFAREVANRVIFMENGKIVEENTTRDFFLYPKQERTISFLRRLLPEYDYVI